MSMKKDNYQLAKFGDANPGQATNKEPQSTNQ